MKPVVFNIVVALVLVVTAYIVYLRMENENLRAKLKAVA